MPFEVIKKSETRGHSLQGKIVSISPSGALRLSLDAWHALGDTRSVRILVDRKAHKLALEAAAGDPEAFNLTVYQGNKGREVIARAALEAMDAQHTVTRRYPALLEDGRLIVDLSKPGEEVEVPVRTRKRTRKAA